MRELFVNELAERALIKALVTEHEKAEFALQVLPSDMYVQDHQAIIKAIHAIIGEKGQVDFVTVDAKLGEMGEIGTARDTLVEIYTSRELFETWASSKHVEIIKACALRRQMLGILDKYRHALIETGDETLPLLESVRQELRDVIITRHSWMSMSDVLVETYNTLADRASGKEKAMPFGVESIDAITMGLHRGELTIVGARPAVGKSAFGAQIAMAAASAGYKVGICSREMTAVQYGTRILSRAMDIDPKKLRTGNMNSDEWAEIVEAMNLYRQANVSFMFSTRYVEDLRTEVQKKVDSGDIDMLVVDYVQLLQSRKRFDKDYLRIGYISKMLKDMTVDFGISIIGLAQVGRAAEGTMPTMAELRGSGDIEQDADNIVFLHKPENAEDQYIRKEDKSLFQTLQNTDRQYMVIKVAKQRQGETGMSPVVFDPKRMRFNSIVYQSHSSQ